MIVACWMHVPYIVRNCRLKGQCSFCEDEDLTVSPVYCELPAVPLIVKMYLHATTAAQQQHHSSSTSARIPEPIKL